MILSYRFIGDQTINNDTPWNVTYWIKIPGGYKANGVSPDFGGCLAAIDAPVNTVGPVISFGTFNFPSVTQALLSPTEEYIQIGNFSGQYSVIAPGSQSGLNVDLIGYITFEIQ
jgi:hypothetical protein